MRHIATRPLAARRRDRRGHRRRARAHDAAAAHPRPASAGTPIVAPATVFSQDPYKGVRCGVPNSIACDAVGLAWLRHPARSVTATIDGRALAPDRFGDQPLPGDPPRTSFDGYLRPSGVRTSLGVRPEPGTNLWLGDQTPRRRCGC